MFNQVVFFEIIVEMFVKKRLFIYIMFVSRLEYNCLILTNYPNLEHKLRNQHQMVFLYRYYIKA